MAVIGADSFIIYMLATCMSSLGKMIIQILYLILNRSLFLCYWFVDSNLQCAGKAPVLTVFWPPGGAIEKRLDHEVTKLTSGFFH